MNEKTNIKDVFARLTAPFQPSDIEWRAGATNSDKTKALALAYITSRAVMDRLDEAIGPENWKDEYAPGPNGGVICGLSLRINDEWITKWDGAENTDFEAVKGGLSDAFKRAGYKWGIGRYLYRLESVWVACEARGKSVVLKNTPTLPSWALPDEWVAPSGTVVSRKDNKAREQQILKELGFSEKPKVETTVKRDAPISPGPSASKNNGSNSNGKKVEPKFHVQPGGKRKLSWNFNLVNALVKAKLASDAATAVQMLNDSDLEQSATPEQAVARIKELCIA